MRHGKAGWFLLVLAVLFIAATAAYLVTHLDACQQAGGTTTHTGYCSGRTTP